MERFPDPLLVLASPSPLQADWASEARAEPRYLFAGLFRAHREVGYTTPSFSELFAAKLKLPPSFRFKYRGPPRPGLHRASGEPLPVQTRPGFS
jgi:hypothetical protein